METFTWTPAYKHKTGNSMNVISTEFESGKKQWYYKGTNPRTWVFSFVGTLATINAIRNFWIARKGPYEAFSMKDPETDTFITVRFSSADLSDTRRGMAIGSIQDLTMEEVL